MNKIKRALTSENGMKIINVIFFLAMLVRNRGIIFAAYTFWIIYLACCIKNTSSKAVKAIYKAFIVYAAAVILANVYFYITLRQVLAC